VDNGPAFASVSEAMDMARAALGYLAAADATALATATQAECLRGMEQTDAIATAARACFLSAFSAGQGYCDDGDYTDPPTAPQRSTKSGARKVPVLRMCRFLRRRHGQTAPMALVQITSHPPH